MIPRIITLIIAILLAQSAIAQSKQLLKTVDQIKEDLKNNAWEVMDEGLTDINKSASFSTGPMTFYTDREYIFAAVIDNCYDCNVKVVLSNDRGEVMNVSPEIDRLKNLTRVIYYLQRDEVYRGELQIYVDSPVKYTTYVLLARGKARQ